MYTSPDRTNPNTPNTSLISLWKEFIEILNQYIIRTEIFSKTTVSKKNMMNGNT